MARHLDRLMAHLAWANDRTLASLRAAGGPADALGLFAHVLAAEHVWHARLTGEPAAHPVWPELSLDQCERLARENVAALAALARGLDQASLDRPITYRNSAGREFTDSSQDILLHVALHGAYHRGQVAALLRRGGAVPEPTDYIAFTRGAPAATRDAGRTP